MCFARGTGSSASCICFKIVALIANWHTLAVNGIAGCGQYKYRENSSKSQSYILYCSRDGEKWLAYIVWAASEKVMGPFAPDPSLD